MYLILNSSKLIVEISKHAFYVKHQTNNVNISCPKEEAEAICSVNTDKLYPVKSAGLIIENYTLTEVDEVPPDVIAEYWYYCAGEFYTTGERQAELTQARAAEDVPEILIDLAYRTTLLELGVSIDAV